MPESLTFTWGDGETSPGEVGVTASHTYDETGDFHIVVNSASGAHGETDVHADTTPKPKDFTVGASVGLDGPNGEALVGGGGSDGVRIEVKDKADGKTVPVTELAEIAWGDGVVDNPPDTSGGYSAHRYTKTASGVKMTVKVKNTPGTFTSAAFDVIDDPDAKSAQAAPASGGDAAGTTGSAPAPADPPPDSAAGGTSGPDSGQATS